MGGQPWRCFRESSLYPLPEPLALRGVCAADHEFLQALYFSSREDLHHALPEGAALNQLVAMQYRMHQAGVQQNFPDAVDLIVLRSGQAIGRVLLDTTATDMRLVDIAILPAARRAGVARTVLGALQAQALRAGRGMSLAVARSNTAARALYAGLGFEVQSEDLVFEQLAWRPQP